ncbi:ThiF family adenylyltransferase [Nocardia vinacea]|uniref:ThiF family adenylyltransferase n=1 Tax=Nocardia vinacea TaxID=96468 RepID=UPI0002F5C216|nr:ThiF family adenylyltransferase [Nocardia vinacea]
MRQLVSLTRPDADLSPTEVDDHVHKHLDGKPLSDHGVWVWYRWSRTLVHLLPRDEFRQVRTDRNRYKIAPEEQRRLARAWIGIVGLSVGNATAVTLALEGIGGSFKIADFDRLELSNLNRLRGSVADPGVEKSILAARQMFEIDPYLEIDRFAAGVAADTVDEFLLGTGRLDLLIEECDDLYIKILIRERARAYGIPVLMDTSDRGLLGIERFDLEPDRPIQHGLLGSVQATELRATTAADRVPLTLAILGEDRLSTRSAASLPEIGRTVGRWPQLASEVTLGAAIGADTARRLLLGEPIGSGRFHIDLAALMVDRGGEYHTPISPGPLFEIAPEARAGFPLPPEPARRAKISEAAVRWIAAVGTLAPPAHNAQPWSLLWRGDEAVLECRKEAELHSMQYSAGWCNDGLRWWRPSNQVGGQLRRWV